MSHLLRFAPALVGALACVACAPGGGREASGGQATTSGTGTAGETSATAGSTAATDGGTGTGNASGGASSGTTGGSSTGPGPDAGPAACPPVPACDGPLPDPGPAESWRHTSSELIVLSGSPNHRLRDMFYLPGDEQWLIGKFSYGLVDKDLKDEDVDVWVQRDCTGPWELLGTGTTTTDGQMPPVEGVEDTGGRIYFRIPAGSELALGRHRVYMVVKGDLSGADGIVEIVEPGTPVFVTDVDGTLTTQETAEFTALLTGQTPDANPFAAEALSILASKGYRPFYLTARPEYLVGRTREFVAVRGFPPGVIHTTLTLTGATGSAAVAYKTDELYVLDGRDLLPAWAIGNTASDGEAYATVGIAPDSARIFYQFDDPFGGRRIESYAELLDEFEALPAVCP